MAANAISFSEADWEQRARDFKAWWEGKLERPLIVAEGKKAGNGPERSLPDFLPSLPEGFPPSEIVSIAEENLAWRAFYGDAYPAFHPNFGPGIAAVFTGLARLRAAPHTVWFEPATDLRIQDMHARPATDGPWFQRVSSLTQEAVLRLAPLVQIAHTDLGGGLDMLASFLGTQRLLCYLVVEPEEVERLIWETHDAWWHYQDELGRMIRPACRGTRPWAPTWAPGDTAMLQSDFAYMISPEMFERFVLPELSDTCRRLDYAFYHLDGVGQLPHLELLLSIPELHGIQWVPGTGQPEAAEWPDVLRRIRDAGKLVQIYCTKEDALGLLRTLGGRGFLLAIQDDMTEQEAEGFLAEAGRAYS